MTDTYSKVRAQFGRSAERYVSSAQHAKGAELALMVELAGEVAGERVLDIATGGGHTALAFAKAGAEVVATDLTPEMLRAAEAFFGEEVVEARANVTFTPAAAEELPFDNASFDIVTCRIAAHHFADPQTFLKESARVLKPGGTFMLVDNVAPTPGELARVMNHIEKVRDPSHVEAYSVATWLNWFSEAHLELVHFTRWETCKDFREWLTRAQTPEPERDVLEAYVLSLPDAYKHYFGVDEQDDTLLSLGHEAALFVATKLGVA